MKERLNPITSLYLHFPFCRHLCNYCDFYKIKLKDAKEPGVLTNAQDYQNFLTYLNKSYPLHENLLKNHRSFLAPLETLYIGGGTPSLWGEAGAKYLDVSLASNAEATLEVNPGSWTKEGIQAWEEFGINRFSIGLQSTQDFHLKLLDRVHNREDIFETLEFFSGKNFSVDLMLGLPHSILSSKKNERDIISEITEILPFKPKHFSIYILTVGKNYPLYSKLPDEDFISKEYLRMVEFLQEHGFGQYEVSNFSLSGFESKHNCHYWNQNSVAALGPSATGFLNNSINPTEAEVATRYKWKGSSPEYSLEHLNKSQFLMEKLYLELRTNRGTKLTQYLEQEENRDDFKLTQLIESWNQRSYLSEFKSDYIRLNARGFLVLDSIINEFFNLVKQ